MSFMAGGSFDDQPLRNRTAWMHDPRMETHAPLEGSDHPEVPERVAQLVRLATGQLSV